MTDFLYQQALAEIHDRDYTFLARAAAATALALLPPAPESGVIVDLGCGSGVTAEILDAAGYTVVGIDASPDMLAIARQRVPSGHFRLGSIYDADIPDCQAVLAIGEVLNYEADDRTPESLNKLLRDVARSLVTDGFLLCDVAGPGRAAATATQQAHGDHWSMDVTTTESAAAQLTRDISIQLETGWAPNLSSMEPLQRPVQLNEVHLLDLFAPDRFTDLLATAGLTAERLPRYDGYEFPTGWDGWVATPVR